ncbi:MAG: SCO family protein [Dinoroseobacter sp.]|nr:SCO family protein [Dinoroseobacter sp.]
MKIYALTAVGLISAMLGGLIYLAFFNTPEDALAQCRGGVVASGNASIGGPFELVNETGATVTDADVITAPTLVYFGYTFCPDVCPLDAYRNGEAADLLKAQGYDVQTVFITVDPARDTPEQLGFFTDAMHPDMIGLTGTEEQVAAASKAYKTYYRKQDGDPEYYLVDHSTFTYLMLPQTGFADFFRREDSAQQIAERTACFLDVTS